MTAPQPTRRCVQGAIRTSYLDWGGNGPPLVLLHGLTTSAETWTLVARLLAPHFHIYALDQRGHGESDKPDMGYDYASLSADLEAFFAQVGLARAAVGGQSWGAGVALRFAARFPARVSRLILVEGGYFRPRRDAPTTREQWEQMLAPLEIYAARASYLRTAAAPLEAVYSQDIEDILMASVRVNPDGSISEKLSREHQVQILRAMWEDTQEGVFRAVSCPTLLLPARSAHPDAAAGNARKERAVAAALAELRNGRVHWVENSVHDVQLHRPEDVAHAIMAFLTQP
ncbi:MAG: alpha/beta hydrolase [Chloroflexi bacterium]|nr:alpha/beta hydrolase [Chloroflexota bacterium]